MLDDWGWPIREHADYRQWAVSLRTSDPAWKDAEWPAHLYRRVAYPYLPNVPFVDKVLPWQREIT